MKIVVAGAGGMLAQALIPILRARGHEVVALDRTDLDVTDAEAVTQRVERERPDAVVQCAAYTQVDQAEADEAGAMLVNATSVRYLAGACRGTGALLVYPSTDYVFPGVSSRPYRPDDPTGPLGAYGRSKLAGEEEARRAGDFLIVRTSWLYGRGGPNFVDTISRLAAERDTLRVVDDQVGRPTWTDTLARAIAVLVERRATGTMHVTDGGEPVSWFGFTQEILRQRQVSTHLIPVTSGEFARPAPRPSYSVLDCTTAEEQLGYALPDWKQSLASYLASAGSQS